MIKNFYDTQRYNIGKLRKILESSDWSGFITIPTRKVKRINLHIFLRALQLHGPLKKCFTHNVENFSSLSEKWVSKQSKLMGEKNTNF